MRAIAKYIKRQLPRTKFSDEEVYPWEHHVSQERNFLTDAPNSFVTRQQTGYFCLSYYDESGAFAGILIYFPEGREPFTKPGESIICVDPDKRHNGIGTKLLIEAMERWDNIDLYQQEYTKAGRALAKSIIEARTSPEPTKAQRNLLVWMRHVEKRQLQSAYEHTRKTAAQFQGGDLIDYYAEQHKSKKHGKEKGGYADHGWRRAGGSALKRLSNAGFVDMIGFSHGVPIYLLNDVGRGWADHYTALNEMEIP